jgi:hypothetical protein
MRLESPDQEHFIAAEGFSDLGLYIEANAGIEQIDPFCRCLPEVLITRLAIYHGLKKWELMQVVARKLQST